jgi:hypothetical protein
MEISYVNTLYSYLKQKKCLFFFKNREQVLSGEEGWYQWEGKNIRKGCRRVNVVEIFFTYVFKWKKENC